MTPEIKIKSRSNVYYPTQANCGLEWGTRRSRSPFPTFANRGRMWATLGGLESVALPVAQTLQGMQQHQQHGSSGGSCVMSVGGPELHRESKQQQPKRIDNDPQLRTACGKNYAGDEEQQERPEQEDVVAEKLLSHQEL